MRLRESLSSVANATPVVAPPPPPVAPRQEAAPKPPAEPPKVAVATVDPGPACKQDEARLSKIRANPSLADLAALERDLGCERLRPQIVRLRESLPKTDVSKTDLSKTDLPKPEQPRSQMPPQFSLWSARPMRSRLRLRLR